MLNKGCVVACDGSKCGDREEHVKRTVLQPGARELSANTVEGAFLGATRSEALEKPYSLVPWEKGIVSGQSCQPNATGREDVFKVLSAESEDDDRYRGCLLTGFFAQ